MSLVIGIDVGGSTTKIVGIEDGNIIKSPMNITANDPITSLFGAFGKYLYDNNIALEDVEHVMLTGVGSSGVTMPIYGLPTTHVDEFVSDGLGARFDSGLDRLVVVSMGTGTTLVRVDGEKINHIGGISMGGGTLQGLSHLLLKTSHIDDVVEMASRGDISHINLQIKDISKGDIEGLPMHATASLFESRERQRHSGRHCQRTHLHGAGDHRLVCRPVPDRRRFQGFCADRQLDTPA